MNDFVPTHPHTHTPTPTQNVCIRAVTEMCLDFELVMVIMFSYAIRSDPYQTNVYVPLKHWYHTLACFSPRKDGFTRLKLHIDVDVYNVYNMQFCLVGMQESFDVLNIFGQIICYKHIYTIWL